MNRIICSHEKLSITILFVISFTFSFKHIIFLKYKPEIIIWDRDGIQIFAEGNYKNVDHHSMYSSRYLAEDNKISCKSE